MLCSALLLVFIVGIVALGSLLGGGSSSNTMREDSENSTFTAEEFITGTNPFESTIEIETTAEPSSSTLTSEDEAKPATEEETRDPCRTKTGILCKGWMYYGQNISSG